LGGRRTNMTLIDNRVRELNPEKLKADGTEPKEIETPEKTPVEEPKTPVETPREEPKEVEKEKTEPSFENPFARENEQLKEKLSASSREAIRLAGETESQRQLIENLTNDEQVTDEEVKSRYKDFDFMSETEQELARDNVRVMKSQAKLNRTILEEKTQRDKDAMISRVIAENPDLAGREGAFVSYASKPKHKNTPLDVLAKAFLHEIRDEVEDARLEKPPVKQPVVRPGLEGGSAGGADVPKGGPKTYTSEEIKEIRMKDNKRYLEMIRNGELG